MDSLLSDRVKQVVEDAISRGISVTSISKFCGVSRQAVYQWKSGETKSIDGYNLVELAEITGFSSRWIINGRGQKKSGLSQEEKTILDAFRLLDNDRQEEELETARRRIEKASTKSKAA